MSDTCTKEDEKEDRTAVVRGRYVVARGQSGSIVSRWEEGLCEMKKGCQQIQFVYHIIPFSLAFL